MRLNYFAGERWPAFLSFRHQNYEKNQNCVGKRQAFACIS